MSICSDDKSSHIAGLDRIGGNSSDVQRLFWLIRPNSLRQRIDCLRHHRPFPSLIRQCSQRELCSQHIIVVIYRLLRRGGKIPALVDQRLSVIGLNIDVTPDEIPRQSGHEHNSRGRHTHSAFPHLLAQICVSAADQNCSQSRKLLVPGPVAVASVVTAEGLQLRLNCDVLSVLVLNRHGLRAEDVRYSLIRFSLCKHGQDMAFVMALQKELNLLPSPDRLYITG